MIRTRLTTTAAVLVFAAAIAGAHDTWLLPEPFRCGVGGELCLDLTSGMEFPNSGTAIRPDRIAAAGWRLGGQTDTKLNPTEAKRSLRLQARPAVAGVATAWVTLKPRTIELTEKQVAEYLDEVGAGGSVRRAWADAGPGRRWREQYTKHAKTFVRVGGPGADRSWAEPVGQGLEVVPEADPTDLRAGGRLPLRVLKGGKPLAGFVINLAHDGKHTGRARPTDRDGRTSAELPKSGRWLLAGTDLRPVRREGVDWESDFATLTVEVAPKPDGR